ncbi:MAG: hypothetical protein M3Y33_01655 [Actinomycetota bacterium]|nr:hypothetical protein [Actinomycetota bacterium]
MSVLIGVRIELRGANGELVGSIFCEDKFETITVPQRGDLLALTAIAGPSTADSSLPEIQAVHALADAFPFMKVDHLEHYPTADFQIGDRPGCIVVVHGAAPSSDEGALALVQLFGLKGWTVSPGSADPQSAGPFNRAAYAWMAEKNKPRED